MKMATASDWSVQRLEGKTTTMTFRDPVTGEWSPARAALHETVIHDLLSGKRGKRNPKLWVVTGGIGVGKSTLIRGELAPKQGSAVVIDADQLWRRIPEYEELAAANWRTAGDYTYQEVRYLRDAALAEAAARRLNIILEISGDEHSEEVVDMLEHDGYEASIEFVHCSPEEARERIRQRANTSPTPEDNLWCSPPNAEFPDKHDYHNVDVDTFRREHERRKSNHQ